MAPKAAWEGSSNDEDFTDGGRGSRGDDGAGGGGVGVRRQEFDAFDVQAGIVQLGYQRPELGAGVVGPRPAE
ncbi:hypothetical protein A9X05_20935 [Mycobacterium sp. E3298]|nr:hypothetical protein A9X05_20935 [Mycobacterium sp. E3298]